MELALQRLFKDEIIYSDMCKISKELADDATLKKYMAENKPKGLENNTDPDVAVRAVRETMMNQGLRTLLFDEFPMQYFICPIDGFMSPAEIMVKMDRNSTNEIFNKAICYFDGGHKDLLHAPKHKNQCVYKVCTVIPNVGLIKLAVTVLPAGESSEFLIHFWKGINTACRMWLESKGRYTEAKNFMFAPYAWCGDSAGGQWLALRQVFNIHTEKSLRGKFRVTDMITGRCLEMDCDLHLEKDIALHAKRIHDKFQGEDFIRLARDWYKTALAPNAVIQAENSLQDFIDGQENKIVKKDIQGWFDFYIKEGERVLHLFRQPESGKAEILMSIDNRVLGRYNRKVDWVHKNIASFIVQAGKLQFIFEGGQPSTHTSSHVEARRTDYYQKDIGGALGKDLMEQVASQYRMIADDNASRSHRADKKRRTTPTATVQPEEETECTPVILDCKNGADTSLDLSWLVDENPLSITTVAVWRDTDRVDDALMVDYTLKVHNDTSAGDNAERKHMVTQQKCNYRREATKAQAKNIMRVYTGKVFLNITLVLEPTRVMNARMRITDEVTLRGFVLSDTSQVTIGRHTVDCDCDIMRTLMRGATSNYFQWCKHILFLFKKMGKVPGDFELVQCGFTPGELKSLVALSANVTSLSLATPVRDEGVWMVARPTGKSAKCQACNAIGARRQCNAGDRPGYVGPRDPRIIVQGRRNVEGKWVPTKYTFHVMKTCVNNQFDSSIFKIGTPPMMYMVQPGYGISEDVRLASGLDIRVP